MPSGTAVINFGSFPGRPEASVTITGQSGITLNSKVGAWLRPAATTDHSVDEHRVEQIKVFASDIVAGVGFTIFAEVLLGGRTYGLWNVDWAWV